MEVVRAMGTYKGQYISCNDEKVGASLVGARFQPQSLYANPAEKTVSPEQGKLKKSSSGDQGKLKAPANSPRSTPCPYCSHNFCSLQREMDCPQGGWLYIHTQG